MIIRNDKIKLYSFMTIGSLIIGLFMLNYLLLEEISIKADKKYMINRREMILYHSSEKTIEEIKSQFKEQYNLKIIDVRKYGALGNGVSDDTVSIQNALDSAIQSNEIRVVLVPSGIYKIRHLLIDSNTILIGDGQHSVLLMATNQENGNIDSLIRNKHSYSCAAEIYSQKPQGDSNIHIYNLSCIGNKIDYTNSRWHSGIGFYNVNMFTIENVKCDDFYFSGIHIAANSCKGSIKNSLFNNCGYAQNKVEGHGITIFSSSDIDISSCIMKENSANGVWAAVYYAYQHIPEMSIKCTDINISNCIIMGSSDTYTGAGIYFQEGVAHARVYNCLINEKLAGIWASNGSRNITIIDNCIYSENSAFILADFEKNPNNKNPFCSEFIIQGNYMNSRQINGRGVIALYDSQNVIIAENIIASQRIDGFKPIIDILSSEDTIVKDNEIVVCFFERMGSAIVVNNIVPSGYEKNNGFAQYSNCKQSSNVKVVNNKINYCGLPMMGPLIGLFFWI